jgi:hypothetical protein
LKSLFKRKSTFSIYDRASSIFFSSGPFHPRLPDCCYNLSCSSIGREITPRPEVYIICNSPVAYYIIVTTPGQINQGLSPPKLQDVQVIETG